MAQVFDVESILPRNGAKIRDAASQVSVEVRLAANLREQRINFFSLFKYIGR